jgi:hypothetical protein
MSRTKTYFAWQSMKDRCLNPRCTGWPLYGGRGIKICKRWLKFENFLADMGEVLPGMTIERKRVNGHYTPSNCHWIPNEEQSRNTRRNRFITYRGKCMILADWAKELGINHASLRERLEKHTLSKALSTERLSKGLKGEAHLKAKLSNSDVRSIRRRYKFRVMSSLRLAREFSVSKQTILKIVKRSTWGHI